MRLLFNSARPGNLVTVLLLAMTQAQTASLVQVTCPSSATSIQTIWSGFRRGLAGQLQKRICLLFLYVHGITNQSLPPQEENRPVGGFSLRGSLVSALEDNGVPTGKVQLQLWPKDLWDLHQHVINTPEGQGGGAEPEL